MKLEYRIEVTPDDNGTFLILCPQLPIVATFAEDRSQLDRRAADAIETALASMIDDAEDIPPPDGSNSVTVRLPLLTALRCSFIGRCARLALPVPARRHDWNAIPSTGFSI